jgi:hypothetical protein
MTGEEVNNLQRRRHPSAALPDLAGPDRKVLFYELVLLTSVPLDHFTIL